MICFEDITSLCLLVFKCNLQQEKKKDKKKKKLKKNSNTVLQKVGLEPWTPNSNTVKLLLVLHYHFTLGIFILSQTQPW